MSVFNFKSPSVQTRETDQSIIGAAPPEMGPIIIGRTKRGPAAIPATIDGLDNYNLIFGEAVAGGSNTDVWRNGINGPTYAAYAAQSWLASETTPINVVRLLGEQDPSASTDSAKAGWKADNAYGLYIFNSADNRPTLSGSTTHAGTLAAVFYTTKDGSTIRPVTLKGVVSSSPAESKTSFSTNAGALFGPNQNETMESAIGDHLLLQSTDGTKIVYVLVNNASGGNAASVSTGDVLASGNGIGGGATLSSGVASQGTCVAVAIDGMGGGTVNKGQVLNEIRAAIASANGHAGLGLMHVGAAAAGGGSVGTITLEQAVGGTAGNTTPVFTGATNSDIAISGFSGGGAATKSDNLGDVINPDGADFEYTLSVQSNSVSQTETEAITFNFNRNSSKYIRNVLNTNPTLLNTTITPENQQKSYWLGETFERNLKNVVTDSGATKNVAVMLPLISGSASWGDHKEAFTYARSGWFISQDFSNALVNATTTTFPNYHWSLPTTEKLFRCVALGGGQADNTNFMIAIKDLKLPSNPTLYGYGTFTLQVVSLEGNILESFTNLNFDPTSNDFILRRIGDEFLEWNSDLLRYEENAATQYQNISSYIRIEMFGGQEVLPSRENALPFGFLGPIRPRAVTAIHSASAVPTNSWTELIDNAVYGGSDRVINHTEPTHFTGSITYPRLSLRKNGSDGLNPNPALAYWGVQPTISSGSTTVDSDLIDYLRPISNAEKAYDYSKTALLGTGSTGDDATYEYSFDFSLDNIVLTGSNGWHHSGSESTRAKEGSRVMGTSYSAQNGHKALLDKGVSRFYAPMHGGFDGLDILEQEPLGNHKISSSDTGASNYVVYTLHKALNAVADAEVVPANLLLAPGQQKPVITDQIVRTAQNRQDLLAIIDLENDYSPATEATASSAGDVASALSSYNNRTNINSSYGCTYYPAVQIADTNSGQYVWVPSSVAGLGAMAQSQKASELWFAPAGFNRGGLGALGGPRGPVVIQARQRLDSSQRDDLYEVNINPIASFPNEGVVIFGQKTLFTPAGGGTSALDRINVRRLMIFLKKEISDIAKTFLFEQNNSTTRGQLSFQITSILSSVASRFGLSGYRCVIDESNNTADDIDNNRLNVSIFVKPTRAIEFIAIDFIIQRSGVEFAE